MHRRSALFALLLAWTSDALASTALEQLAAENGRTPRWIAPERSEVRLLTHLQVLEPGRSPGERALSFLHRTRSLFLSDESSGFAVVRVVDLPSGPVVQLAQAIEGLPIYGAGLTVSFDLAGRITTVVSGLVPVKPLLRTAASAYEAAQVARALFEQRGRLRGEPSTETAWWQTSDALLQAHLVTIPGAEPFGDFLFVMLGDKPRLAYVFERTQFVVGYAYPHNPVRDTTYQEVELPNLTSSTNLTGSQVEVWNCTGSNAGTCGKKAQLATPDADGNYLIKPEGPDDPSLPTDRFGEVQAYYGINQIYAYFTEIGASPSPLKIGVNFPMSDAMGPNAFYSSQNMGLGGPGIMIGQWGEIDLSPENDVIFHEYGHHVFGEIAQSSGFAMDKNGPVFWGLAFNEATADYFSCSALDDPELGEYFASQMPDYFPEGYIRTADNDLRCPEGLAGEGHDDGVLWSGFLWDVRTLIGKEQLDPMFLRALAKFPKQIDFPSATAVFLEEAQATLDEATMATVRSLAEERGLLDCERFIPLGEAGHTGYIFGKQIGGGRIAYIPAELHYKIDLPADAQKFNLGLTIRTGTTDADVALLVRRDLAVEHSFTLASGLKSTYDFLLESFGEFDLRAADSQFVPGATYYFQPVNRGKDSTRYTISGSVTTLEEPPDAGTDGDDGSDKPDGDTETDTGTDTGTDAETDAGTDAGADKGGEPCPAGTTEAFENGERICVPECREGYDLSHSADGWTCVQATAGCGCSPSASGGGLAMALWLLALAMLRKATTAHLRSARG